MRDLPYGEWPSPISAIDLARSGVALGFVAAIGDEVWWEETRPSEDGRTTVARRRADGTVVDALPKPWHARTRVHEYGGKAWLPLPAEAGPSLVFAHWDDLRLYLLEAGSCVPRPLTPEPAQEGALRYADLVLNAGGDEVLCVREAHRDGRVIRHIVAVPLDGSAATDASRVREVAGGSDFVAHPRVSPDGRRIAWIAWDHPRMPWDGTEVRVARLDDGGAGGVRALLGGPEESVLQPEWADGATLYAISDRTGWWNLCRVPVEDGGPQALCPREEEFAFPMWTLGRVSYVVLGDGRLAVIHGTGTYALGILDPGGGELADLDTPFTVWSSTLAVGDTGLLGVAGSAQEPLTVVRVAPHSGEVRRLRAALDHVPDPAYLPQPRSEALPGPNGRVVHAHVYPPRNPQVRAPEGEKPPYVVFVHGGPTGQSLPVLKLETAYFTSRGIGVVDVDYGGSAGYGRAYRELLRGQWGVVDVEDCVAAASALVDRGDADRVVPPSQSSMFRDALAAKRIPHAYLEFEGEQHGFRKESTIIAAHEAELSFYGQVFGFEPAGVPKLALVSATDQNSSDQA